MKDVGRKIAMISQSVEPRPMVLDSLPRVPCQWLLLVEPPIRHLELGNLQIISYICDPSRSCKYDFTIHEYQMRKLNWTLKLPYPEVGPSLSEHSWSSVFPSHISSAMARDSL